MNKTNLEQYVAPQIEVICVAIEHGFAASSDPAGISNFDKGFND